MMRIPRALAVAIATTVAMGVTGSGLASAATDDLDVESLIPAIVRISAVDDAGTQLWHGSGTIIDPDGLVLTNAHVADEAPQADGTVRSTLLGVETTHRPEVPPSLAYWAMVVAIDYPRDLAVLRITQDAEHREIEPQGLPFLRLGGDTALGETITILGYPGIGGDTISLTRGEIGGYTGEPEYGDQSWIKTSATIAGGNSGGAAVNDRGELIGIPTRVGAGETGRTVDCRPLADTNGDGRIDDTDTCVPVGGFFNELRPVAMARPLVDAARAGRAYRVEYPDTPDGSAPPTPGPMDQEALAALLGRVDDRVVTDCEPAAEAPYGGGLASVRCEPADAGSGIGAVFLDAFPDEATMVATFDRLADRFGAEACAPGGSPVASWDHPSGHADASRFFCYLDGDVEGLIWSEPGPGLVIGTALGDDRSAILEWWQGHRPAVALTTSTPGPALSPSPTPAIDAVALAALLGRLDEGVVTDCQVSDLAPFDGALVEVRCDATSGTGVGSVYLDAFPDEASMRSTFDALSQVLDPVPCVAGGPEIGSYDHPSGHADAARYFCAEGATLDSLTWIEPEPGLVLATVYGDDTATVLGWWQGQPLLVPVEAATTPEPGPTSSPETVPTSSPAPTVVMDQEALAALLGHVDEARVSDCAAAASAPYAGGLASVRCDPPTGATGVTDVYLDVFPDESTMGATFDSLATIFGATSCTTGEPGVDSYDHPSGDADHARSFCYERDGTEFLIWSEPEPGLVIGTALGQDAASLLAWWQEQPVTAGETATASPSPQVDAEALADLLARVDDRVVTGCVVATAAPYQGALVSVRCVPVGSDTGVTAVYLDAFPDESTMTSTFQAIIDGASTIVTCQPDQEPVGTYTYPTGDADAARFFCQAGEGDDPLESLVWSEPTPGLVIGTAFGDERATLFDWWEANRPAIRTETALGSPAPTPGNDAAALAGLLDRIGQGVVTNCTAADQRYDGALASVRCQRASGTGVSSVFLDTFGDEPTMLATFDRLVADLQPVPCTSDSARVGTYPHLSGDRDAARYFCYHADQREGLVWMEPAPGLVIGTAFGDDFTAIHEWWESQPAIGIGDAATSLATLLSPDWIYLKTCKDTARAKAGATSTAQIGCTPRSRKGVTPTTYRVYRYRDASDLRKAWAKTRKGGNGDCARNRPGTQGWSLNGSPAGEISCGATRVSGRSVPELRWTEESVRLLCVIRFDTAQDGDLSDLRKWWLGSPALSS